MLFHIGRIAIITFLTVLALRPFIAIDPVILVLLISVMCIIYTWMGGIEGVIWTDVIQGLLLSGSAILIFIVICLKVQGGIGEIFTVTQQADKFFPATQFHWSWTESTVPVLMIGFLFANIQQFTASQDVVQRYIVTDSIEETKKTLLTNAKLVAVIPVFFLLSARHCLSTISNIHNYYRRDSTLAAFCPYSWSPKCQSALQG